MKKIIVEDISLCEKLWYQFSPNTSIWDLWKTILSFYSPEFFQPYFIFLEDGGRQGLLPLWLSKESGRYFFFGGDLPENRTFWFPAELFSVFFRAMPKRTVLYDINERSVKDVLHFYPQYKDYFVHDENRYYLDLKGLNHDLDRYFAKFSSKHRKNLFYDMRKLMGGGVTVRWDTSAEPLENMIRLNKERFAEHSDFLDNKTLRQFRSFAEHLERTDCLITLTAEMNDKTIGIEMAAIYKNIYYVLNGGFNPQHENIGKLLIFEQIKKANTERCSEIDFLVGDTGWKELWNLDREFVFTLDKEDMTEEALFLLTDL
ncbi:MAG: GNAT family N-acetyltransferase [Candidatus Colwellbacteria bacterium]|nr:GNAT family N-acetyltransferase [Candidatus Colwellbacteria bacterium]